MKIAVTGKGGVGKTSLTALFTRVAAEGGNPVLAIDADPNPNLHLALGFPEAPPALVGMKPLIEERLGSLEGFFRLNPRVDDIPEEFSLTKDGVRLLVMGGITEGGAGCACPQSAFVRSLLQHVMLERSDWVFMDCEAGLEHLGRATARGADALIVVVEPSRSSIETALRIRELAAEIDLSRLYVVGNKVRDPEEQSLIEEAMTEMRVLTCLPESEELRRSSSRGMPVQDPDFSEAASGILEAISAMGDRDAEG
jgi:CO dehydrogenase maturation factor